MNTVNQDIILAIANNLSPRDITSLSCTCNSMYHILEQKREEHSALLSYLKNCYHMQLEMVELLMSNLSNKSMTMEYVYVIESRIADIRDKLGLKRRSTPSY